MLTVPHPTQPGKLAPDTVAAAMRSKIPGVRELAKDVTSGHCIFCEWPMEPIAPSPRRQRGGDRTPFQCGDLDCIRGYQRLYREARRMLTVECCVS